jgi:hypothetical protein
MKALALAILSIVLISLCATVQSQSIFKNGFENIVIPVVLLNDTGITWSGEYPSGNNADCTSSTITSPQDCNTGRDATHNDTTDGHAGFSFTKLDANGIALANQGDDYATTPWSCVQDNVTGLVWEVKTDDGGLHYKDDRHNWYNTNSSTNGGADGYADDDGAICYGYNNSDSSSFCNTQAFTARVNSQSLCGQTDWRMPDINELHSIVHQGRFNPVIEANYFPNTVSSFFWSSSPYANNSDGAWVLDFYYGNDGSYGRNRYYYVRLVRSGQ